MRFAAAFLALTLGAMPVLAEEPVDAPMTTAGASGAPPMDSKTQIERYLADAAAEGAEPRLDEGPRRIHGEVEVSVGTGGYRAGHIAAQIPIGETGTLGIAYGQTDYGKNGGWYGGQSLGPCLRDRAAVSGGPTMVWTDRSRVTPNGCFYD